MSWLSNAWSWIKDKWDRFEAWVATWMPGLKTYLAAGLGSIASVAGILQSYITGLPLDQFMTATQVAIMTSILFTLAFWFHGMGERVDARTNA